MNVVFRTDASLQIGIGHVMRCLTLADALRARGARCRFICREHPGHLFVRIREHGHDLEVLPPGANNQAGTRESNLPKHAGWLGCGWQVDAAQTKLAMDLSGTDWLVVDHYALDRRWEECVAGPGQNLLVIDDLADRSHDCDLLLDQTHLRRATDYQFLVPPNCKVLTGAGFALLRPEFAGLREYSLARRRAATLQHLLVTLGGIDRTDATSRVLSALDEMTLPTGCQITVVMGAAAPNLPAVRTQAATLRWPTRVRVDADDMAKLMADADLAVGAAGGTAWERCCLGLPAIVLVLAENQRAVATSLREVGAAMLIDDNASLAEELGPAIAKLAGDAAALSGMAMAASKVTDGHGVDAVVAELEAFRG